jgi:tellurite resistance protein TerC
MFEQDGQPMTIAEMTPWIAFLAVVAALLAIDLGVLGRRGATMTTRSALAWSGVWIALGLSFSLAVWAWRGGLAAQEYLAGYLIEESLSIDNLFVFMLVFGALGIELKYQRKVLFWGILGAIVLRGLFIIAGVSLLARFEWVVYLFGALLIFTAYRLVRSHGLEVDPQRNPLVRISRRLFRVDVDYRGSAFTVKRAGRRVITPLAIALVAVESADIVFAVDSVPAVLAVSDDAFVVFTSNVFAILGLRALYFALAGSLQRLEYLSWGLAVVLAFVGAKMLLSTVVHIPIYLSLAVIVIAVGGAVVASLWMTRRRSPDGAPDGQSDVPPHETPPVERIGAGQEAER